MVKPNYVSRLQINAVRFTQRPRRELRKGRKGKYSLCDFLALYFFFAPFA